MSIHNKNRENTKRVTVIYFCSINDKVDWQSILSGQLMQLRTIGIDEIADIYIHICGQNYNLDLAIRLISEIVPSAIVSSTTHNQFEYPAISLVWKLARESPDRIYLYFHSKGMFSGNAGLMQQKKLFKSTIASWRKVLNLFENHENVNKIGLAASETGWIWFNFWWARGTYIAGCEEPKITDNRYYYEEWLYRRSSEAKPSTVNECYSLADDAIGICYSPTEACAKIDSIILMN